MVGELIALYKIKNPNYNIFTLRKWCIGGGVEFK